MDLRKLNMKNKHSTDNEIEYLKIIGETHLGTISIPKETMLKNYVKAFELRVNWGDIDKNEVISAATMQLFASI